MNDSALPGDIADMIKTLEGLDEPSIGLTAPIRFVVATDWSEAAAPLAALRAFDVMFRPDQGVQLVFAVPHEPSEQDAECVHVLLEGAGRADDMRGLDLVSFAQAPDEVYDAAVVPDGDAASLLTQVAGLITRMHDVARTLATLDNGGGGNEDTFNRGSSDALRGRLAAFTNGA